MTDPQKQIIRESYPAIREMLGPVSLLFYGRLFELDPTLKPMFRNDIEIQGRKLMDMVAAVVENLDRLENLGSTLRALGQRHVAYGVRPQHYDLVQQAFVWALGQALQADFYPEVRGAWSAVLSEVNGVMRSGAGELLDGAD